MNPLRLIPPGIVVAALFVLILSAVFYAVLPYRKRGYVPILVITAIGYAVGQGWDYIGLPSLRLGQANVLPAFVFALAAQPLARFVPRRKEVPDEPGGTQSRTS